MILMLPVSEMRMFSIFRSGAKVRDKWTWMDEGTHLDGRHCCDDNN